MSDYPGPQRSKARRKTKLDICLQLGILLFSSIVIIQFSREVSIYFGANCLILYGYDVFDFPLPSNRTSLTILAGFVSLIFVREQFAQGLRPFLTYSCYRSKKNDKSLDFNHFKISGFEKEQDSYDKEVLFKTSLDNIGGGLAIMRKVEYRLSFDKGKVGDFCSFSDVKTKMYENGLEFNKDYWISSFSKGWSIAKEKEVVIFEIPLIKSHKIQCLDILFEYEGLLGDIYEKQVYCIPRHMRK